MSAKKIFILLPDGIGLRNFAYTDFYKIGKEKNFDITYWNNTPFNLSDLGFSEIKIKNSKASPLADIYKNARKHIELNLNIRKANDFVYDTYRFPFSYKTIKSSIKNVASQFLIKTHNSDDGLKRIRENIKKGERKTVYFQECLQTLKAEKPAIVFCTNQRPVLALAPLLAAQELGIPTATFIFSWDNLPKATMVVETDYYFVWSDHMKKEVLNYYPYINDNQIFVTGTPQFELHFNSFINLSKVQFFTENNLELDKKYICFSGDDYTSSPDDPLYLEDTAMAVRQLNNEGLNLGVVFRKCPVDFSGRYDAIIKKYSDVIVVIDPKWSSIKNSWYSIMPLKEDNVLLSNLAEHCVLVLNLGSSMVFDFVCHKKPCAYFRYNQKRQLEDKWDIFKCYNYVHFRSMPNKESVVWLNSADEIAEKIKIGLNNSEGIVENAQKWFTVIAGENPTKASETIWFAIEKIIK